MEPIERRSDTRSMLIAATPAQVFAAMSDPARVARWWGPDGFTNTIHQFDFSPGGTWLLTMHGPDGTDYPNESRFTRLAPGELFEIEHFSAHHYLLTIALRPCEHGTQIDWRQTFDTVEHYEHIAQFVAGANEQNLQRLRAEVLGVEHEIRHSMYIHAPMAPIMDALMREEHIQKWWTKECHVADGKGRFSWSAHGWAVELDMAQDIAACQVIWKCTRSNMQNTHAWEGTTITFTLHPDGGGTRVEFSQTGYRQSPCLDVCTQGWGYFLGVSLKQYQEIGKGIPYPEMLDTSAEQAQKRTTP
ncbi:MAG: SRPBCC domain-containing protein [Comamonadaceae bacterium]|nr:SRPBCC domain-containing protein [Comamonadaceae bacterium]